MKTGNVILTVVIVLIFIGIVYLMSKSFGKKSTTTIKDNSLNAQTDPLFNPAGRVVSQNIGCPEGFERDETGQCKRVLFVS